MHPGTARLWIIAGFSVCGWLAGCSTDAQSSRYKLEKQFFEVEQAWSKAELAGKSGNPVSTSELRANLESALDNFATARPQLGAGDSLLFGYAAGATQHLVQLLNAEQQWDEASKVQKQIATDTLFPMAVRHRALYGWASAYENAGRIAEACDLYRQLVLSFYPPVAEGGVNSDVLELPSRRVALAQNALPESLATYRSFGVQYYDSLAAGFPHTQLAFQALGELARIYGSQGQWDLAITTLGRAADTAGQVFPAYRIDQAEIWAGQIHDTARALKALADLSRELATSPFRIDADLKTADILFRRGQYQDVQKLLSETKTDLGMPDADLAVGLLLARSYAMAGDRERARAEYAYLVTAFPHSLQAIEAAVATAQLNKDKNDTALATQWLARADSLAMDLVTFPGSPPKVVASALNARASLAVESKRWNDAATHLSSIAQTFGPEAPEGASALLRLGWIQVRELHDTLGAAQSWGAFLAVHPNHPDGAGIKTEMNKWPDRYRSTPPS